MHGLSAIHEFLRDAHVAYTVVPHRPAYTAQEEAAAVHVPGRDWAKVVICFVDGEPIQAVLPAPLVVNLDRLLAVVLQRDVLKDLASPVVAVEDFEIARGQVQGRFAHLLSARPYRHPRPPRSGGPA